MNRDLPDLPPPAELRRLRQALQRWFEREARPLPWRQDRDPYRIWVSEVMLQQTQVATVIPYYHRFLDRFPSVAELAAASEHDVLRQWEGLGYYRRARNLHRAAQVLVAAHRGTLPDDPAAVAGLPGIGRYTLGAVLSQAFDRRLPIVDGNVQRVLARWFLVTAPPGAKGREAWFWQAAEQLLPRHHVGDFNQALMELGQLVCVPRQPQCLRCPVARWCRARAVGRQNELPLARRAARVETETEIAVVVRQAGSLLLVRRPPTARRWANLWEFPHGEPAPKEAEPRAVARLARELTGFQVKVGDKLTTHRHAVTRFAITLHAWTATRRSGRWKSPFYVDHAWVRPDALEDFPLSRPQRVLARHAIGRESGS